MLTVVTIATLNAIFKQGGGQILGVSFPMNTDYIAIPAVVVSVTTLVVVTLITPKPAKEDWVEFICDESESVTS